MKSFRELTVAAKQSRLAGISRETFLANLHPSERSDAAMQFDRLGRLTVLRENPPTQDEIVAEAREIAWVSRLAQWFRENISHYADGETLSRIVTGRIMSAGMLQEAGTAIRHANELTEEDIHAAMADARRNLHADEDYLAARLGLAALAH
jgi:hypothetical protein